MTYGDVHERVEAVLLRMTKDGRAEFSGVGPDGPTFSADPTEVMQRIEDAGLLCDAVPWPYTVTAMVQLRAAS